LLLTKTFRWIRPAAAKTEPTTAGWFAGVVAGALLIAGVVVWMAVRGSSPAYLGSGRPRPGAVDDEAASPAEVLKQLAERAEAEAALAEPQVESPPGNQGPVS
jgi:hypothetical protein